MLRISIPSNGPAKIDYSTFSNFMLPMPDGIDSEVNNSLVLLFDDEEKAIDYTNQLRQLSGSQKKAGNEIIAAIEKDMFVRTYAHSA
ncbi:hypothetical protein HDF18_00270 [Mucilaginibacter sp. X5P1]|uniref:hypothetical protein n=1 Tax=Mucilaginibacter sp. X5P1 TaxID=2723088 RepID=UPI001608E810|nr:hypothetical protein [Mucilaginibacter sp. X5P1]MBB6138472.1 hypothetical protein [Mucilaginibacter sp. X5P1]